MVVVGLAAISVFVAMAIAPNVAQIGDQWRVDHTLDRLTQITDGPTMIVRFEEDVGTYPGTLSHLSTAITTADPRLCPGATYSNNHVDEWAGRYAGRLYTPAGTPLPIGMMQDTLTYDGSALVVDIEGVREEQALRLYRKADRDPNMDAAFRVQFTAPDAEGLVTLRWRTEITAC